MAEQVKIEINTGDDAFADAPGKEIGRILRKLAAQFESDGVPAMILHDQNGNTCGRCTVQGRRGK